MKLTIDLLSKILKTKPIKGKTVNKQIIERINTDSRTVASGSLFVALKGNYTDGHNYVKEAFLNGAIGALISIAKYKKLKQKYDGYVFAVEDPLVALQQIATYKRKLFNGKVIAITGSNGKTIVKNAFMGVLSKQYKCSMSIGSYNSSLGVPLAILKMDENADFWIVEAGISKIGEMNVLQNIIKPDFGILTNIGIAHIDGFGSRKKIAEEKLKLFKEISYPNWVVIPNDSLILNNKNFVKSGNTRIFSSIKLPFFTDLSLSGENAYLSLIFEDKNKQIIKINSPSLEIAENLQLVITASVLLGCSTENIIDGISSYQTEQTRMEIWKSPNGITFINDTCSSDLLSVEAALKTMNNLSKNQKKYFIFGGMETFADNIKHYSESLKNLVTSYNVNKIFILKQQIQKTIFQNSGVDISIYSNSSQLAKELNLALKSGDTVLFKGSRNKGVSEIATSFYEAIAPNKLIVDINAIKENIRILRKKSDSKVLAMLKALGYGSNSIKMISELQKENVDFFGVSTPDEAIELKSIGTNIPILVMIVSPDETFKIVKHNLIPVISNFNILNSFLKLPQHKISVHIKVDTGMGRMGFRLFELKQVINLIKKHPHISITGLMTHFCCADDPNEDEFTLSQIAEFEKAANLLKSMGINDFITHAAATSGAVRFSEHKFDMIRIGIGLYGFYSSSYISEQIKLNPALSLVSRIVDIKRFSKGDRLGYSGSFTVPQDNFPVGIIPLGYHDGIPWSLSNKGYVLVLGKKAPIIGRISMDSMQIDLRNIPEANVMNDVLIFGSYGGYELRAEEVANQANSIVYELIAKIGPRVQRIFKNS